jgi:hypothetical protein
VERTTQFHHEITHALLPQADPIFHNATTLDAAVDMLDPQSPLVERLVGPLLLQGQLRTAGLLRRHEDHHRREREGQEAQIGVPIASVQKTSIRASMGKAVEQNEGHFPHLSWAKTLGFLHV